MGSDQRWVLKTHPFITSVLSQKNAGTSIQDDINNERPLQFDVKQTFEVYSKLLHESSKEQSDRLHVKTHWKDMKHIYGIKIYSYLIFGDFLKIPVSKLEKTGDSFQVSIHFHPLKPWLQTTNNSFDVLQWLIAIKIQHYSLVFTDENTSISVLRFD